MRFLLRTLLACLVVAALLAAVAVPLALSGAPAVERAVEFTPAHIARAKRIFLHHDPRRSPAGLPRVVRLSGEDVDLALNHLVDRQAGGSARVLLRRGLAELSASLPVRLGPLRRYVNLQAVLREGASLPEVQALRIGRLPVPARVGDLLLHRAIRAFVTAEGHRIAVEAVRKVAFGEGRLAVTYVLEPGVGERLRAELVSPEDGERLRAHQARLAALVAELPPRAPVTMEELVAPLLRLAGARSEGGDPVAENRAALLVIAFYANGRGLQAIVPAARAWPRPAPRAVLLAGRQDLARHFAISAAISAHSGAPLADAVGLYKELEDARGGSGFSFDDLAADRAGTRFGELAAGDRRSALELQRRVLAGDLAQGLLPPVADLPGALQQREFLQRYGGVGAPAYERELERIERRIDALRVYR
jgi:uncharacterized protein YfiM (DUF2279 family)